MRAYEFIVEDKDTLKLPDMNVGDEVKVGRWKNRKAEIKGFKKDDHGQPVLKTTKGDQKLFKPRISKLETEDEKSLEESVTWDLDGFWITETGKRLDINQDEEIHHATIALDAFSNIDLSDVNLSDEDAENAVDAAMLMAYNNGWIRVVTSPREVGVDFFKLNRISLSSLKKHLADYPWPKYSFSYNRDLNTTLEYGKVESFKELFSKLKQILVKRK